MANSSRAIRRHMRNPAPPHAVAASAAPVAEPPGRSLPKIEPSTTPLPTERGSRPPYVPSLPPDSRREKSPTRFTPVALFTLQTALDMVAIGSAFALSYWVRFDIDIFKKFVVPDTATYATMLFVTVATVVL